MTIQITDLTGTSLSLVPMTELEAMNLMLSSIGESEVTAVDSDLVEAVLARSILHRVSREVQSTGLHCNSDYDYDLSPDGATNKITIPANVLRIDGYYKTDEVVTRGGFLYDKANQTYEFTQDISVNIVWFLDYEDLPQVARDYIAIRAARVFQGETIGAESLVGFTEFNESQAKLRLMEHESDIGEHNIFESYSVSNAIRRHSNPIRLGQRR